MPIRFEARGTKAELYLYDDVGFDAVTARAVSETLKNTTAKEITVRISSYGGDAFEGVAIYSLLTSWRGRVDVMVDGVAASAASVIAMAGKEISIVEAGFIMIHDARGVAFGTGDEMRRFADQCDALSGRIADIYAARTGRTSEEIRTLMRAETWLDCTQSLDLGMADRVVFAERVAAECKPDRHGDLRVPARLALEKRAPNERRERGELHVLTDRMDAAYQAARNRTRGVG